MSRLCGRSLGHHRVGNLIGAGGMGEVYEAEDLRLGRRVALKVLPAAFARDGERLSRFTREARALAALNHPAIVTIHSVDESEGEHFFTMELVEGQTLAAAIPPGGMELSSFLDVAIPLADALAAAHAKEVVHRDLKPGNVMLTADGRVKVLDFGLARLRPPPGGDTGAVTLDRTGDGTLLGTLPYMAPEQLAGRQADARSDLFALGVILWEMAAGSHPFPAASAAERVAAVLRETPGSLTAKNPAVPPELERLVAHCLEKKPDRRPASASDVRAALEAIRGGEKASAALTPKIPSVAVLPFVDMSAARDQEYFCDGIAEEIINALAQLEGLRVMARTSSFAFKGKLEDVREIGRRLGVGAVLEGSVRKAGERLRITTQLIDVADGYHLWSERFDRSTDDIFAVQDEIALGVVEKLKVKLLAGESGVFVRRHEPTQVAYHLYLKGRYFFNRRGPEGFRRAIEHFEKAIATDPAYAMPHLGIAETFSVLGLWGFLPPRPAYARVKAAAARALELDDSLVEAHFVLATALFLNEWDWQGARTHFGHTGKVLRAAGTGGWGLSLFHMAEGRTREALQRVLRAIEDEPLSSIAHTQAAAVQAGMGDVEGAAPLLEKALELDAGMPMGLLWLGFCRGVQGRLEEAIDLLRKAVDRGLPNGLMYLPAVLVRAGRMDEARAAVAALENVASERYVSPLCRALAFAALGDRERSLELLAEAEAERSPMLMLAMIGPGYENLAPDWVREWVDMRRRAFGPRAKSAGAASTARGPDRGAM